ncbi:GntR family transcriptional regulator [Lysinibacter cavernae]|uniref:GntR family transcriptional regulator n=1 Tax=Lysinibacter cavernae TaxID=1640652 RepID=A0A7X5QZ14_9MICO|nr:GntR family transcriptional regulator [Lysinibacter cavernae]NIH52482.1 GntR family transcriptional regulator [Lysinibacter cavernae]
MSTNLVSGDEPSRRVTPSKTVLRAQNTILEMIQRGIFPPGAKLPGERDLAETVGVSRGVLRKALALLEESGHLDSSAWRGWFVHTDHVSEPKSLRSFTELAQAKGLRATAEVVSKVVRPSTMLEAEALAISPAAPVIHTTRIRGFDSTPICVDVSIIPESRAPELAEADLTDASLYRSLEQLSGVRVVRSDYAVHAEAVTRDVAAQLNLDEGDPVLIGEETAFDLADRPVILGRVTYRGDAYRFEASLFREA